RPRTMRYSCPDGARRAPSPPPPLPRAPGGRAETAAARMGAGRPGCPLRTGNGAGLRTHPRNLIRIIPARGSQVSVNAFVRCTVGPAPRRAVRAVAAAAMSAAVLAAAGCSLSGGGAEDPDALVLVTHDSFALSEGVLDAFTEQTGTPVEVRESGDAGALASELVLTKDDPVGDVAFGIDNTFASRVAGQGVFEPYVSPSASGGAQDYAVPGSDELTAIDYGDVCLNIDTGWFRQHGVPEPAGFDDLTDPAYRDLTVVENPATSSPGLAFLLGTVVTHPGTGWQDYWRALADNGVKVVDGWTQAYSVEFSGSSGNGPRPIVVSYASSPPAEAGGDG